MKPKLKIFEDFSQGLLPHEAVYLQKIANFQDEEKRDVFEKLIHNAKFPEDKRAFDFDIDKRKYHYIKTWVEKKLNLIDVDITGEWLLDVLRKLKLDLITAEEERQLLDHIKHYKIIDFNFIILYELIMDFRAYLMIRLRFEDHQIATVFLNEFANAYQKSKEIQEKLYQATIDITDRYTLKNSDINYWEKWLNKVFETEAINGNNRYKAFILMAFHYNTTKNFDKLKQIFDQIDVFFSEGQMYCRRLLYNYYSSRVLLHTQKNELNQAAYFGKLSVRQNNEDTLMYVNNLVSIFIRLNDFDKALALLQDYHSTFEKSHNYHQKITYFSYNLRVLGEFNQLKKATNQAVYFLNKYESEILKYRWHIFFTTYLHLLLKVEDYEVIVALDKKYDLSLLEAQRKKTANYIPNVTWCVALAQYMENRITKEKLFQVVKDSLDGIVTTDANFLAIKTNVSLLVKILPEFEKLFKSHLA